MDSCLPDHEQAVADLERTRDVVVELARVIYKSTSTRQFAWYFSGYYGKRGDELDQWPMTFAKTVPADAKWQDGNPRRARCPLCDRYPRSGGFTERGLLRHLRGWGNAFPACPVMEVVRVHTHAYRQRLEAAVRECEDKAVTAVLSGASNVKRLVTRFTEAVVDLASKKEGFPEITSGAFVSFEDVRGIYEQGADLSLLEGRVSPARMTALGERAALTSAETAVCTKPKLAAYFAKPVEGRAYVIRAVTSSSGQTAYWTETRRSDSRDAVERKTIGIFPSVMAAKAALRRRGLLNVEDYRPRRRARALSKTWAI